MKRSYNEESETGGCGRNEDDIRSCSTFVSLKWRERRVLLFLHKFPYHNPDSQNIKPPSLDHPQAMAANLPAWATINPLNGCYGEGKGDWEELFDYGGIRYHACLYPSDDGNGVQDEILSRLGKASENNDDAMDDYADECRRLIWPLIERDCASRPQSEKSNISPFLTVKIEGRTVDGILQAFQHNRNLDYATLPIVNTFPGIPTFPHTLVNRIERLEREIFKVQIDDEFYCLKTVHSKGCESGLKREIFILQQCHHPSILTLCGVVVNDDNKIEGMLTEFIPGAITLDDVTCFNEKQYHLWISQIQSALEYLHHHSLVWGDAKPANILKRENNDVVLVDFAGGATDPWVNWKEMNTREADLKAFNCIKEVLWRKLQDLENQFVPSVS